MITLTHLTREYPMEGRILRALDDVSLHIAKGEYAAIVGPSGSGKSTLMHILGCLDKPTYGTYLLGGQDVSALDDRALARVRGEMIGFVFQGCELIPRLSALENAALPLLLCGADRKQRLARAEELLHRVGLADRLHHRPAQLSGGQRQRVAIARALVRNPAVLLADEPTGALDPSSAREVLSILDSLHREGRTILLITHDSAAASCAKRRFRMENAISRKKFQQNPLKIADFCYISVTNLLIYFTFHRTIYVTARPAPPAAARTTR